MATPMLSDYSGRKVGVICEECELLKYFDGSTLLEKLSDKAMPSLLEDLSDEVGCTKPKAGFYNRCKLTYYFTHQEWAEKMALVPKSDYDIALGKRLSDLMGWEVLHARCRCSCGREGKLSTVGLQRRYGDEVRIAEIQRKLRCQKCNKYDSVIKISSLPR